MKMFYIIILILIPLNISNFVSHSEAVTSPMLNSQSK